MSSWRGARASMRRERTGPAVSRRAEGRPCGGDVGGSENPLRARERREAGGGEAVALTAESEARGAKVDPGAPATVEAWPCVLHGARSSGKRWAKVCAAGAPVGVRAVGGAREHDILGKGLDLRGARRSHGAGRDGDGVVRGRPMGDAGSDSSAGESARSDAAGAEGGGWARIRFVNRRGGCTRPCRLRGR